MRTIVSIVVVALALPASADPGFGAAHQLAISSDANVAFQYVSISPGNVSSTTILLEPALDYFVVDKVSVGGFVLIARTSTSGGMTDSTSTTFGIGPRVGYHVVLGDKLSIWPKASLTIASASSGNQSSTNLGLTVFAPLLYHPAPHFYLGIGPALHADLSGDFRSTTFGLLFTIGGWI